MTKVPVLVIRGTVAAADAATALEAGIDAFVNGGDERLAILAAAQEADRVSQLKGYSNHARCECTETMALTQGHCCQRCLLFVLCHTRKFSVLSACWLCEACMVRDQRSVKNDSDLIIQLLRRSLRRSSQEECRVSGIDWHSEEYQDHVYSPALKEVCARNRTTTGNLAYLNDYTNQQVQFGLGLLIATPQTPSVDAVFPKWRVVRNGEQMYYRHISGNLAVTDAATNRFKYLNLPGFLAYTSDFVNKKISAQDYLNACDELTKVRFKTPLQSSGLKKLPLIDDVQWSSDMAEMRACKTAAVPGGAETAPFRMYPFGSSSTFSRGDKADLTRIYREICQTSGAQPVFSADGCPWVLGAGDAAMPREWSWKVCFSLFSARLTMMTKTCNRKWKSEFTPYCIWCSANNHSLRIREVALLRGCVSALYDKRSCLS
jgi:hypothetical protein